MLDLKPKYQKSTELNKNEEQGITNEKLSEIELIDEFHDSKKLTSYVETFMNDAFLHEYSLLIKHMPTNSRLVNQAAL
jgi:hypothetical protein